MPGLALMSVNGPVYATKYCTGQSWTVPHIRGTTLDNFLPTEDDIEQYECAIALMLLRHSN